MIAARSGAISIGAVAKREAFAEAKAEAEAFSNFEISGRDTEFGVEAAHMKRRAYAEAIAHIEGATRHQLVNRATEEKPVSGITKEELDVVYLA